MIPKDIADTYDYIVVFDGGIPGGLNDQNDIRLLLRKLTLAQAYGKLVDLRTDLRATIRMPEPRQPPWKELPALIVSVRVPAGALIRLDEDEALNLLQLLMACGYRTDGIEPFTFARGSGWLSSFGSKLESELRRGNITSEPDFTFEELNDDTRNWLRRQLGQGEPSADSSCPECGSSDVVIENGFRGCRSCGKATPVE